MPEQHDLNNFEHDVIRKPRHTFRHHALVFERGSRMPPVIVAVLSAVGVMIAAKWLMREAQRINTELHPPRDDFQADGMRREPIPTLRRDASGVYRPTSDRRS
jgi:hypothetical protein